MMSPDEAQARFLKDPRTWPEFRKTRRALRLCFAAMISATLLAVPAAWIVLEPNDPLLRPDVFTSWAWAILIVCALVMYMANRMNHRVKLRYATQVHKLADATRAAAEAMGVTLDVEMGQAFPTLMISRRHKLLGVCAPTPTFIKFSEIADVAIATQQKKSIWDVLSPNNAIIQIVFTDQSRAPVVSMGGNGLSRVTADETYFVSNKLHQYVFPPASWRPEIEEGLRPETLEYLKNLRLT